MTNDSAETTIKNNCTLKRFSGSVKDKMDFYDKQIKKNAKGVIKSGIYRLTKKNNNNLIIKIVWMLSHTVIKNQICEADTII